MNGGEKEKMIREDKRNFHWRNENAFSFKPFQEVLIA